MSIFDKFYYTIWNIGFIEKTAIEVVQTKELPEVHWLKHNYRDRFFADPFILSADDEVVECLVEDFPHWDKRGYISKLIIDRKTWSLQKKLPLIVTNYHQSFPYIHKMGDKIYIIPESSQSGKLICWELNGDEVINPKVLVDEPLLDPTFHYQNGLWWLFCTKFGPQSNKELHIYYAKDFWGSYTEITQCPAKNDIASSRPAGYTLTIDGILHRVAQISINHYGEGISLTRVDKLTPTEFTETVLKRLYPNKGSLGYNRSFHTLNECNRITVVDGTERFFMPLRRFLYTIINLFLSKKDRGNQRD